MKYKIERNVPIPPARGHANDIKYIAMTMKPGDSIGELTAAEASKLWYHLNKLGYRVVTRQIPPSNKIRAWCIKGDK